MSKLRFSYQKLFLLLALFGCAPQSQEPSVPPERPIAVRTFPVREGGLRDELSYVGTLHSTQELRLLARIAGTVRAAPVASLEPVEKGDTLIHLTAPELEARIWRAQAEVQRAQAEASFLCEQAQDDQDLAQRGALSPLQVRSSRRGCAAATAAVDASSAVVSESEIMAERLEEKAPFAGILLDRLVEPGQHVMPGTPLVTLGSKELEVRVIIAESDLARGLRVGLQAQLRFTNGEERRGEIWELSRSGHPGFALEARVSIPQGAPTDAIPGMAVNVDFILDELPSAITLPWRAIFDAEGEAHVFVVEADRVRKTPVELIRRIGEQAAVRAALSPGQRVAVDARSALLDGSQVYAVPGEGS